ncbi:MAG: hypothetical protein Q4G58_06130 [bacterium]|nr:hypothetical protein [bacterium]
MEKATKKRSIKVILLSLMGITVICAAYHLNAQKKTVVLDINSSEVAYMTVGCYPVLHDGNKKVTDPKLIQEFLKETDEEVFYYWGTQSKHSNRVGTEEGEVNSTFTLYNHDDQPIARIRKDGIFGGYVIEKEEGYYIFEGEQDSLERISNQIINTCAGKKGN